ncbi:MAG: GNAT family N-acetyltransferase [Fimbriimonadales bacterium]|nr:GNAT family N-acetyltransferase [Fimbriimonadales bacterium]MDW8052042.1 GNAT family N-acetyltransferase [Armatimonadota bacterium]
MTPIFRALRPKEQQACIELWARVFTPGSDFFSRYFADPWWQPHYTRVCEVDGQLVAAVQIVRRPIRLRAGYTLWMAGIANVATLPAYRGQGFASRLMQEAQAVMDSEDFAFGLLFTGIRDFYARLGWETLPLPLYEGEPVAGDLGNWRFRVAREEDLPHLQRWYEALYADRPLSVVRNDAYWRVWTRWEDAEWRHKFYLAEDPQGTLRGYVVLETRYESDEQGNRTLQAVSVAELAAAPEDIEAQRMLVGYASQTAHMAGVPLEIYLPEADVERLVRPLLARVEWMGQGGAMVRVCNWQIIREAFEALDAPAPENLSALGQANALALLLGLPLPDSNSLASELRQRYPIRPACYSPVDSF